MGGRVMTMMIVRGWTKARVMGVCTVVSMELVSSRVLIQL